MTDARPGLPLQSLDAMQTGKLYHFVSANKLWTVCIRLESGERGSAKKQVAYWACLESSTGYSMRTPLEFRAWYEANGQPSPLEPPPRWQRQPIWLRPDPPEFEA